MQVESLREPKDGRLGSSPVLAREAWVGDIQLDLGNDALCVRRLFAPCAKFVRSVAERSVGLLHEEFISFFPHVIFGPRVVLRQHLPEQFEFLGGTLGMVLIFGEVASLVDVHSVRFINQVLHRQSQLRVLLVAESARILIFLRVEENFTLHLDNCLEHGQSEYELFASHSDY